MNVTAEFAKRVIPAAVDRELERLGWSQSELARRTGLSRMTVSNICTGKHEPKASVLKTIADTLGVATDLLLSEPYRGIGKNLKTVA